MQCAIIFTQVLYFSLRTKLLHLKIRLIANLLQSWPQTTHLRGWGGKTFSASALDLVKKKFVSFCTFAEVFRKMQTHKEVFCKILFENDLSCCDLGVGWRDIWQRWSRRGWSCSGSQRKQLQSRTSYNLSWIFMSALVAANRPINLVCL